MLAGNDNECALSPCVCVRACAVLFLLALFVVLCDAGCFVLWLSVCVHVRVFVRVCVSSSLDGSYTLPSSVGSCERGRENADTTGSLPSLRSLS